MRYSIILFLAAVGMLALPALAQPPDKPAERGDRLRGEIRERVLKEFDKDGSGLLNEEELAKLRNTMRDAMREIVEPRVREGRRGPDAVGRGPADRRGPLAQRGPADPPDPEADRGPSGRRGSEGRPGVGDGPRGRQGRARGPLAGPSPPPILEPLFDWFDRDDNDQLSREEFATFADFLRRHHPRHPGGPPDGPRFGRGSPGGPPPRGEDRPERRGPDGPPQWPDGPPPDESAPDDAI